MPTKGKPKLTKKRKAKIVAEKALGIATVEKIGEMNGVCTDTVYRTVRDASPEVLALADEYKPVILEQAKLNVKDGLKVMYERMFWDKTPLKEITGAVKVSHDIVQIQTGQPTAIAANIDVAELVRFRCWKYVQDALDGRTIIDRDTGEERFLQAKSVSDAIAVLEAGAGGIEGVNREDALREAGRMRERLLKE